VPPGSGPADQRGARSSDPLPGAALGGAPADAYQSPGALHVHSVFSYDGHGEADAIAAAARASGLEWIGMTDHDTLGARYEGFEGYRHGVHVVVGYEWSPKAGDHTLIYGEPEAIPETHPTTLPPGEVIRIVGAAGAMAFVAHPDEVRTALRQLPPLPWHDWSVRGMTGIELWNYMSEWAERLTVWNALDHAWRPARRMRGPSARTVAWWDALNRLVADTGSPGGSSTRFAGGERLTVGVSGVDAHGEGVRLFGRRWTVFPYERVFRTYTNVLLLEAPLPTEAAAARGAILRAIRDGRILFADRSKGDPLGTTFEAFLPDGRLGIGGVGVLAASATAELIARLPVPAEIHFLRDGQPFATANGRELRVATSLPGAYRIEARRAGRAWLFTNPIVLAPE
jgi:PHP domain